MGLRAGDLLGLRPGRGALSSPRNLCFCLELLRMGQLLLCVEVLAFGDFHRTLLSFQITGRGRALQWSATRCARDSSAGSSAPRRSAVPQWAGPGATLVRCVLPSPTPAAEASSPTSAPEPVKVSGPFAPQLGGTAEAGVPHARLGCHRPQDMQQRP